MIGVAIKTEIKSEIKIEIGKVNIRNKYKNIGPPKNLNYIHVDGIPCRSTRRKANKLPDLPQVDDTEHNSSIGGLPIETPNETNLATAPTVTDNNVAGTGLNKPTNTGKDSANGLSVETSLANKETSTKQSEASRENNEKNGLHVETLEQHKRLPVETSDSIIENKTTHASNRLSVETGENNNKLTVETTKSMSNKSDKNITEASNETTIDKESPNDTNETGKQSNMDNPLLEKDSENSTVSEAALGLIMLHKHDNSGYDDLLDKYDNSSLLSVDAACHTDYTVENPNNNNKDTNNSYDSDDTIILQHEIEDSIGENNTCLGNGLNVETNNSNNNADTTDFTAELSKLMVNQITNTNSNITPVSPNKGTVVFRSYKLCRHATNTDSLTASAPPVSASCNSENEIQLVSVPSGNSTRPPPPNKYKIRKFQIDNVRYYSCLYCNKHFDSIHHLNNHHKHNHPPVSCDVCNKLYDTPNSLIRHSYTHLSGQYQCNKYPQTFHFKSELDSHSYKHSEQKFYCKKCDKGFIRNSDLNVHLDIHGQKWKCSYKGCNKECADKCYLNTHMKVHSNELKYPCCKCKK